MRTVRRINPHIVNILVGQANRRTIEEQTPGAAGIIQLDKVFILATDAWRVEVTNRADHQATVCRETDGVNVLAIAGQPDIGTVHIPGKAACYVTAQFGGDKLDDIRIIVLAQARDVDGARSKLSTVLPRASIRNC